MFLQVNKVIISTEIYYYLLKLTKEIQMTYWIFPFGLQSSNFGLMKMECLSTIENFQYDQYFC